MTRARQPEPASAHADLAREQERKRIAREIHDEVGGNLTAIKMALALLTKRLPGEDVALTQRADYINSLVDRTIEAIHRISSDLRPAVLDFGIVSAIEWQAREFETQSGIACSFTSNRPECDLHADHASALFRIAQEALTNIAKHAQARQVRMKLAYTSRAVQLDISDDGRGIADEDRLKPQSFGIRGMMERARALGGKLDIAPMDGGGTTLSVRIPLGRQGKAAKAAAVDDIKGIAA
ncbi:sensor histidine kinase [Noviherbaspirillum galbum]|uniref:Sensor histidine kinase n=1 Tax=Noviherbaspirillum galbum TaxID=2709383 RepID=A0A6B3SG81_9BURK|nr:sensor histidine kinase [Noviherbaspirillum galbum]NEX59648.1 sensor histidine kinase [Noviherbaspirillum galbum]